MHKSCGLTTILVVLFLNGVVSGCTAQTRTDASESEHIRQVERERLRALVDADLDAARRLHADDFQLINPAGAPLSKDEYLGVIESGQLKYVGWEAGDIMVKLHGDLAVIRYKDVRFDVNLTARVRALQVTPEALSGTQ